ncbi:MAG: PAS domain-containing protein [Balneolales bacterium]|nr:PAS domain-containing protein [Balneolales bacterium]
MFFNLFAVPVFIAVLLGLLVTAKSYTLGNTRGERYFGLSMASTSVYGFFYSLELSSANLELMTLFLKLQYLGAPFIIPFLLLFAIRYTNSDRPLSPLKIVSIFIIPLFVMAAVLTNSFHGLAYTSYATVSNGFFDVLITGKGPAYQLHVIYSLILTLIADIYIFMLLFTVHRYFFWRVFLVFTAITLTWLVYILHLLGIIPLGLDAVPFMFLITGLLFYVGLVKAQFFNVIPAAHRQVFQNLNQGLLVLDNDDRLISANNYAEMLLGLRELSALPDIRLLDQKLPGLAAFYQDVTESVPVNTDLFNSLTGQWIEISIQSFKTSRNQTAGKVITLRDITSRRNTEIEREQLLTLTQSQNERLQQFAHIASHNLRSHCTNISALISFLEEDETSLKDKEDFRYLKTAAYNLQDSIEHLSEVARLHTSSPLPLQAVSLRLTAERAIAGIIAIARSSDVRISHEIPANYHIWAIPAYLDSIFLNLLTNGIRYRSPGNDSFIHISCTEDNDWLIIHVKDNGLGIDLERNKRKLFGMFNTFHEHPESRGIGLFMSKAQIEAMGGKIDVESTPGQGSVFHLWLRKHNK